MRRGPGRSGGVNPIDATNRADPSWAGSSHRTSSATSSRAGSRRSVPGLRGSPAGMRFGACAGPGTAGEVRGLRRARAELGWPAPRDARRGRGGCDSPARLDCAPGARASRLAVGRVGARARRERGCGTLVRAARADARCPSRCVLSRERHQLLRELGVDNVIDREQVDVIGAAVRLVGGPLDAVADFAGHGLRARASAASGRVGRRRRSSSSEAISRRRSTAISGFTASSSARIGRRSTAFARPWSVARRGRRSTPSSNSMRLFGRIANSDTACRARKVILRMADVDEVA